MPILSKKFRDQINDGLLQAKENNWQIRSIIVMDDVDFLKKSLVI
jgi:hypothetical protein